MIKFTFILITILILNPSLLCGQSNISLRDNIDQVLYEITSNLNSFNTKSIKFWDESTEGADATGYFDEEELKLIKVIWYGELGRKQIEFYYNDNLLLYVFEQDFEYNRPIYWDDEMAEDNGDSEVFEPNKIIVIENKYYFQNEKLIAWIDSNGNEKELKNNSNEGQRLVDQSIELINKLTNK